MSSIPNDQEKAQFMTRFTEIPLVKAFCQTVASTYETTKTSNRYIEATLDKAEGYAKYANEQAEPIKKLFDRPLSAVNKIADHQLEGLQRRFPAINTTPHEIVEYGQNLYVRTGVKRRFDDATAAKEKITDTVLESTHDGQSILNRYVSGALDFSENVVDRFVASPDGRKRRCVSESDGASYSGRVKCISNKVIGGVSYRASVSYDSVKGFTVHGYETADKMVKNAATSVNSSIQKAISDTARIRDAVSTEIVNRSRAITQNSDSLTVSVTKAFTNGMTNISDRLIASATPFLPEGMQKPAAAFVSYTYRWQERIDQASSTGEIWKAATDETVQNYHLIREFLQSILNNGEAHLVDNKRW